MNSKSGSEKNSTACDARIDAALRLYGGAVPEPGLESRVASRLAAMPRHTHQTSWLGLSWMVLLRNVSVGALAAAAACAIILGTVRHSQQLAIPQAKNGARSGGISVGNDVHVPTHAVPQSPTIDPAAPRTPPRSRAVVSNNAGGKQSAGATPRSPYPPGKPSPPQQ